MKDRISEAIEKYPSSVYKNRKEHIRITQNPEEETAQTITANTRTIPGIITSRGCSYAGYKGEIGRAHV